MWRRTANSSVAASALQVDSAIRSFVKKVDLLGRKWLARKEMSRIEEGKRKRRRMMERDESRWEKMQVGSRWSLSSILARLLKWEGTR